MQRKKINPEIFDYTHTHIRTCTYTDTRDIFGRYIYIYILDIFYIELKIFSMHRFYAFHASFFSYHPLNYYKVSFSNIRQRDI